MNSNLRIEENFCLGFFHCGDLAPASFVAKFVRENSLLSVFVLLISSLLFVVVRHCYLLLFVVLRGASLVFAFVGVVITHAI